MRINLLDHGYIEFIEAWGKGKHVEFKEVHHTDAALIDYEVGMIEAARQSTQGSFRGWGRDMKLLTHLWEHRHNSPFEFAGAVIEVQAPIMVFREWHRHRMQSYNEMSARYEPLPCLYYTPDRSNVIERGQAITKNKQAIGSTPFNEGYVDAWLANVDQEWEHDEAMYQTALANGIPKELARITMPVGHYTRMRAQANLRNWFAFLTLRMDPNAQWEIRQYANALGEQIISKIFPRSWWLFNGEYNNPTSLRSRLSAYIKTLDSSLRSRLSSGDIETLDYDRSAINIIKDLRALINKE